jgi:hypothetical protein
MKIFVLNAIEISVQAELIWAATDVVRRDPDLGVGSQKDWPAAAPLLLHRQEP